MLSLASLNGQKSTESRIERETQLLELRRVMSRPEERVISGCTRTSSEWCRRGAKSGLHGSEHGDRYQHPYAYMLLHEDALELSILWYGETKPLANTFFSNALELSLLWYGERNPHASTFSVMH